MYSVLTTKVVERKWSKSKTKMKINVEDEIRRLMLAASQHIPSRVYKFLTFGQGLFTPNINRHKNTPHPTKTKQNK